MSNYYDNQLSHMTHLMFFGESKENKDKKNIVIENKKYGADGNVYGIVKEGTKYYVKTTTKDKENILESFDYIGGFNNRKDYEYSSYADAVKDMNMKLMSLNEDYGKRVPVNEAKKNNFDFMDESMSEMKEDIARYRQIMENIGQIYVNKKSGIGDRNIGVPEAPKTTDFKPEIGGPFEDKAKYEANRDNKENAKNFKGQGGPFEKDSSVSDSELESDKAPKDIATDDKLGQPYTDAAQYVPDNSVAAQHPKGGEVVRVNESFEEENPDIESDEFGQLSPESDALSNDEILSKLDDTDEDGETPDYGNDFWNEMDPEYRRQHDVDGEGNEIAGIDDMSGVDRNDIVDSAVNEAVEKVLHRKNLDVIAESVAKSLLKEDGFDAGTNKGEEGDRYFKHDSDFRFKGPDYSSSKNKKAIDNSLSNYMAGEGNRKPNLHKNKETGEAELYDESPNAPKFVNPFRKELDKNSPNYGENKYGLNMNDDPNDDDTDFEKRHGAWENTTDVRRKFSNYFLLNGLKDLIDAGADPKKMVALGDKISKSFEHGVYVLQRAKNAAAQDLGISPRMIENFLSSNFKFGQESISDEDDKKQVYTDSLNKFGYRDAKVSQNCFILPDGELPLNQESKAYCEDLMNGQVVIGPSLKAVGYTNSDGSDLSTEDLRSFVDDCMKWDSEWTEVLDTEEETMKSVIEYINSIKANDSYSATDSTNMRTAISQWYNIIEQFGALQSLVIIPMEVLNRREDAEDLVKYGKFKRNPEALRTVGRSDVSSSVPARAGLSEETTVLHDFGKHPGYRKKPMVHPENVEDAPNGAKDWNDDSTKSSEPFGKKIGSSSPYDEIVKNAVKAVITVLKENQNKK